MQDEDIMEKYYIFKKFNIIIQIIIEFILSKNDVIII